MSPNYGQYDQNPTKAESSAIPCKSSNYKHLKFPLYDWFPAKKNSKKYRNTN